MKKACLILALAALTLATCAPSIPPAPENTPLPPATEARRKTPSRRGTAVPPRQRHGTADERRGWLLPAVPCGIRRESAALDHHQPRQRARGCARRRLGQHHGGAAAGRTAAQVADAQIAEVGEDFGVTRSEITMDGMQAIVVDGLPGPDSWRKVFVVANDRFYTMEFQPWFPSDDPAQPTLLENLYTTIVDTIHFLP